MMSHLLRRPALALVALLAVAALCIGLADAGATSTSPRASAQTVRIAVDSFTLGSQAWVAQERGYFQRFGLNPQIQTYSTGVDGLDAVLTGQADMGIAIDFAALTRMATDQLRIVATALKPSPGFHQLAVRGDVRAASDLAGKTMAIATGTAQQYVTLKYLMRMRVPVIRVKLVTLPSAFDMVSALRSGSISAAFVWGPAVAQAQNAPGVSILTSDAGARASFVGYLVVKKEFLASDRRAVENTLRALSLATSYIRNNMSDSAQIISKYNRAPSETVLTSLRSQNFVVQLKTSDLDELRSKAGFEYGAGITRERISVPKIVDARALSAVHANAIQLNVFWKKRIAR